MLHLDRDHIAVVPHRDEAVRELLLAAAADDVIQTVPYPAFLGFDLPSDAEQCLRGMNSSTPSMLPISSNSNAFIVLSFIQNPLFPFCRVATP